MKKNNFISLQCSSESFEKSIALYYSMNQQDFYNQYNVNVFYGHNLPKKNKKLDAIGTIGFYNKYYSKTDYFKHCSKKELVKNKKVILKYLLLNSIIVKKNYNSLLKSKNYWLFIKNLPFEYLFPNHSNKIIEVAQKELNIKLIPLYFEDNFLNCILKVDQDNKFRYCIYSLELNGQISRNYLKYDDTNSFSHFINFISKKTVLSGNSAFFLEQIERRLRNNYILGYRLHSKNIRPNRNYVLNKILDKYNCILEPKNIRINSEFSKISNRYTTEEKANIIYAKVYLDFINKYNSKIKLKDIKEEWYSEIK